MTNPSDSSLDATVARRQELSALIDGELAADGVQRLCTAWRNEAPCRESWHAYNLIGDVMRSEELASSSLHDEQFLRDLRSRLVAEPVVLAPDATSAGRETAVAEMHRGRVRSWRAPAAMAAGLMIVVGAMVATQVPRQAVDGAVPMAAMPASTTLRPASPQLAVLNSPPESNPAPTELVFDGQVIRDPRLDRYLLAHKQFSGSSVLGAPSGFLRNAAAEVPAR